MDQRSALPACAQLLHASPLTGSSTSVHLCRLPPTQNVGRDCRRRAWSDPQPATRVQSEPDAVLRHANAPSLHHSITPSLHVAGFEDDDEDEARGERMALTLKTLNLFQNIYL